MSLIASFTAHDGVPELSVDADCIKALHIAPISYRYITKFASGYDEEYFHNAYNLVNGSIKPAMKENASKHELTINIEDEKAVSMKYNDKEFFDSALKQITTETLSFSSIPSVRQAGEDLAKAYGVYLYKKSGTLSSLCRINGIGVIYSKNKPINFFGTMSLLHSNIGAVVMPDNHAKLDNIPNKDQDYDDSNIVELSNVVNVMDLNKIIEPSLVFWSSLNPEVSVFGLNKFVDMHDYTSINGAGKNNGKEKVYFENGNGSIRFNDVVGMVNQNLLEQDIKDNIPEFNGDNFDDFQTKASEYIRAHAYDHAVHDFDDFLEL
jgi:hypothetical protein